MVYPLIIVLVLVNYSSIDQSAALKSVEGKEMRGNESPDLSRLVLILLGC